MTKFTTKDYYKKDKFWILHYDNMPVHTVLSMWQPMANKQVIVLDYLPYLLDLCMTSGSSLNSVMSVVKDMYFASVDNIKDHMTREIRCLMEEDFSNCFQVWQG